MATAIRPDPHLLRRCRTDLGLSREQVAVQIPCSARTVMSWEVGARTPSWPMLDGLCRVYGVPVQAFVTDSAEAPAGAR